MLNHKENSISPLTLMFFLCVLFLPNVSSAQNISSLIADANGIVLSFIPLMFGVAVLTFVWGVARYIFSVGDEKSSESGRAIILRGVIGLFVVSAVWGIVKFIEVQFFDTQDTFTVNQTCTYPIKFDSLNSFVCQLTDWISSLLPIISGLMLIVFIWGIAKYIYAAGDPKSVEKGRSIMLWGIIGFFVITSIWGIVRIVVGDFGFSNGGTLKLLPE